MASELGQLARRFTFNRQTIGVICDAFESDDWSRPASADGGNTAHWILGHIATSRRILLRKLGEEIAEDDWESEFSMDSSPKGTDGYPSPATLLKTLAASDEQLVQRLEQMSDADADEEWGSKFPDGSATIGGGAHFLFFHECYHVGQLGLMRRIVGKPGFA